MLPRGNAEPPQVPSIAVVGMMDLLTTYPQMLAAFAFCLFAFGIGMVWLLWPKKMQEYALKHCTKFYFWQNPFLGWMKTRSYLVISA
jgi:hypothetical protein